VLLGFGLFYRVLGCFSAMGVQRHYKKQRASCKKIVSKGFDTKIDKTAKTVFFLGFVSHVIACLGEWSLKHF
jgi:hypothetical protein